MSEVVWAETTAGLDMLAYFHNVKRPALCQGSLLLLALRCVKGAVVATFCLDPPLNTDIFTGALPAF